MILQTLLAPVVPALPVNATGSAFADPEVADFEACLAQEDTPTVDPALAAAMLPPPAMPMAVFTLRLDGTVYEISVAQGRDAPVPEPAPDAVLAASEPETPIPPADPPAPDFTDLPLRSTRAMAEQGLPGPSGLAARLVVFDTPAESLFDVLAPAPLPDLSRPLANASSAPEPPRPTAALAPSPPDPAPEQAPTDCRMELTLAVEDLGPLHFSMETQGDVIRVHLTAEHPVSLDLLRRHAAELVQNLHDAGYREAKMSFGQWQQGRPSDTCAPPRSVAPPPSDPADPPPQPIRRAGRRGVDIKF